MKQGKTVVLIVNHDENELDVLIYELKEAGFNCHRLFTVSQVRRVLQAYHAVILCVITGYYLPDGLGSEVAELCRSKGVPCMGVLVGGDVRDLFKEAGVDLFLRKPFGVGEFLSGLGAL